MAAVPVEIGWMEAYKRGARTVWDCKYHLVWVTKYRYSVLGGRWGSLSRRGRSLVH
jgi:REP element-mobilizing transposase RayT